VALIPTDRPHIFLEGPVVDRRTTVRPARDLCTTPAAPAHPASAATIAADLVWIAPFYNVSGYADEARAFVSGLEKLGIHVAAKNLDPQTPGLALQLERELPSVATALSRAIARSHIGAKVAVLHVTGDAAQRIPGDGPTVVRTMYETNGLPAHWVRQLNTVDEIWVPTEFNKKSFRDAGVTTPIEVVPGGVDTSWFRPDLVPLALPLRASTTFLSVFEWSHRKAPDVLLHAWAEAFDPTDDVALVLRCFPRSHFGDSDATSNIEDLVDAELSAIGRSRCDVAPIVVIGRHLSFDEMRRLMAAADVYVSPTRGEGWGRPLVEAQACGKPVICTNWSAPPEIVDPDAALLIDVEDLVVVDGKMDVAHYRGQRWASPSTPHLAELLRWAANHPDERAAMGQRGRRHMEERWSWSSAAAIAARRITALTTSTTSVPTASPTSDADLAFSTDTPTMPRLAPSTSCTSNATASSPTPTPDRSLEHVTRLMGDALAKVNEVLTSHQVAINALHARIEEMQLPVNAAAHMVQGWSALPFCAVPGGLRVVDDAGRTVMGYRRPPAATAADPSPGTAAAYLGFEDAFRGSAERVRELVRPYAALLDGRRRVVELGCGRGELLSLLADAGVSAIGVDRDEGMLSRARERGLCVVEADLLEYLAGQPDRSADGIVSVEVFEHLDPAVLPDLLSEARRVLEPGGVLLAETVNPHNVTAHKLFWLDPTHRHPLFPETLVVLAGSVGFDEATIMFPDTTGNLATDLAICDRYILVARIAG
jgi:glycosyltransferase involved in cell wall biosynthesis/SAM-dependent methyltransferase